MKNNAIIGVIIALIIGGIGGYYIGKSAAPASQYDSMQSVMGNQTQKVLALNQALRKLWADHMQYTYLTVDSFFHNQKSLEAHLARLLQNQKDIGAAIVSYYGQAAGDKLTNLLTTHINQAVPVLKAAQAGDKAALDKALGDWYANAEEIAAFLSSANPKNWPESATKPMLKEHIDTTTTYAVDLLKGDYAQAVKDYDKAFQHMMGLADALANGIVN